jgi:hypothetical protein
LRHFPTIDASKLINLSSLAKDELTKVASTLIGEQKQGHE